MSAGEYTVVATILDDRVHQILSERLAGTGLHLPWTLPEEIRYIMLHSQ
jgi:hypothetical protein